MGRVAQKKIAICATLRLAAQPGAAAAPRVENAVRAPVTLRFEFAVRPASL